MVRIFRLHGPKCQYKPLGREFTACQCPIWIDGKEKEQRVLRALGTRDWAEAERYKAALDGGGYVAPAPPQESLGEALQRFLASKHDKAEATRISYNRALTSMLGKIGDRPLGDVSSAMVALWRDGLTLKPRTVALYERVARIFFKWAVDMDLIVKHPMKTLRPKRPGIAEAQPFTEGEIGKMLEAIPKLPERLQARARALVLVLRYSGQRIGDVVTLRRDRLVGEHIVVAIMKAGGKVVSLRLHPDAIAALHALPASEGSRDYFLYHPGQSLHVATNRHRWTLYQLWNLAGIKGAYPHRFRDTFAIDLLMKGVPIRDVQLLLGHYSVTITESYYGQFVLRHQARLDEAITNLW